MSSTGHKYRPKDVLDLKFNIPLYQRLFAWTEVQVKKLMTDLKEYFDSSDFKEAPEENKAYYLGLLTAISPSKGHLDLIDGQQRFTVMTLISVAFKDIDEWKMFLDGGNRIQLAARSEDEGYLRRLAADPDLDKYLDRESMAYPYENKYMKNALIFIRSFVKENYPDEASRKEFALNIFKYLTFFVTELPEHYKKDPMSLNKYFEVMNSTGKGLENHEILKVKLLRNQGNPSYLLRIWNAVSQMDRPIIPKPSDNFTYEDYAERYRRAIQCCRNGDYEAALDFTTGRSEDNSSDLNTIDVLPVKQKEKGSKDVYVEDLEDSIISFPEFLLLVLSITKKRDGLYSFYQPDRLLSTFEAEENQIDDVLGFYNMMLFCRLLLDYYVVRREIQGGEYSFVINLRDGDTKENRERLRQYLSMLTVSTEFYIWMQPYFKHILEKDYNAAELLERLKREDNKRHKVGSGDGNYPGKLRTMKYQDNIDRYWFWRLDYYLWENRDDTRYIKEADRTIVEDYVFRINRSIEHLHPQNEEHNDKWNEKDDVKNGFGNLAMISQSFNSAQRHDNINVKFGRIKQQIESKALQSLKMLVMFRSAEGLESRWTEEKANENLELMCDLLERTAGLKSENC